MNLRGVQVDESPAPTTASLRGEMSEGKETDSCEQTLNGSTDSKSRGKTDEPANGNCGKDRAAFIAIVGVLVVIIIALAAALGVEKSKQPPPCPAVACWCPDGWFRNQGKSYYFSKSEGNWTYSQNFCSSHGASLAVIESLQELESLLPFRGKLDHWIGLRKDTGQVWKWANGTKFDHRFQIQGGADCAYLDEELSVISSSCSASRKWICNKSGTREEKAALLRVPSSAEDG